MILFPIGISLGLYSVKLFLNKQWSSEALVNSHLIKSIATLENKIELLFSLQLLLSIFLFFVVCFTIFGRFISFSIPYINDVESCIVNGANKVIQNTLEQTFIFLVLFAYWVLKKADDSNLNLSYSLIIYFVFLRIVLFVNIFLEEFFNLKLLKVFVYSGTLACNLIVVVLLSGYKLSDFGIL